MISRIPKVLNISKITNQTNCFLLADFQSAQPFHTKVQIKKGITNNGLFNQRLNIKSFDKINFTNYSIKDKPVTVVTQDKYGNIWFAVNDN